MLKRQRAADAANLGDKSNSKDVPTFWAYNARAVDKGKREFEKIWGSDRKLTDNWRRSKRSGAGGDVDFADGVQEEIFDLTKDEAIALFKQIGVPMDDKAAENANNSVIDAMSALGTLYRERLNNIQKSVDILEQLVRRYPDNKYKLESLYALYIQHKQLNNTSEAAKYRAQILKEAANSKFAKAIEDPNFLAGEKAKEQEMQALTYNSAYADLRVKMENFRMLVIRWTAQRLNSVKITR